MTSFQRPVFQNMCIQHFVKIKSLRGIQIQARTGAGACKTSPKSPEGLVAAAAAPSLCSGHRPSPGAPKPLPAFPAK